MGWRHMLAAALGGGFVLQGVLHAPYLPDVLASSFDFAGRPQGWMEKRSFFVLWGLVVASITLGLPATIYLARVLPDGLINLPNKDYWLAPERRAESLRWIDHAILEITIATQLLLLVIGELVLQANRSEDPRLPGVLPWLLVPYLGATALFIVRLYRRFPRPARSDEI